MSDQASVNGGHQLRRRPGPFGPAWALLPKGQQPLSVDDSTPIHDALDRMIDNNYSQLPMKNKEGRIIGVFTWKSFCKRVSDLRGVRASVRPVDLPVRDAMEPAKFIHPEVYIDTETDWSDLDYVLVGTDSDLMGILSIADVLGRLNDFAEAFVLVYEIEHEIRDLIRDVSDDSQLQPMIASMQLPPDARRPSNLEDFTFIQYKTLICSKSNWPSFEPVFDTMRELVDADIGEVSELRNAIVHFRRQITPRETDRLRRFRDKLRYNRSLYAKELSSRVALDQ
jgi:CBS domain-containing protein